MRDVTSPEREARVPSKIAPKPYATKWSWATRLTAAKARGFSFPGATPLTHRALWMRALPKRKEASHCRSSRVITSARVIAIVDACFFASRGIVDNVVGNVSEVSSRFFQTM